MTRTNYRIYDTDKQLAIAFSLGIRNTEEKIHLSSLLMQTLADTPLNRRIKVCNAVNKVLRTILSDDDMKRRKIITSFNEKETDASSGEVVELRKNEHYKTVDFLAEHDIDTVERLYGFDPTEIVVPRVPKEMSSLYSWKDAGKIFDAYMNNADSYVWEHSSLDCIYFAADK